MVTKYKKFTSGESASATVGKAEREREEAKRIIAESKRERLKNMLSSGWPVAWLSPASPLKS